MKKNIIQKPFTAYINKIRIEYELAISGNVFYPTPLITKYEKLKFPFAHDIIRPSEPIGIHPDLYTIKKADKMSTKKEPSFYMVYLDGQRSPTYKHNSLEYATREAERLSRQHGFKAYVLKTKLSVETKTEFIEKKMGKAKENDLPF